MCGAFGDFWWKETLILRYLTFVLLCAEWRMYIDRESTDFGAPVPVKEQLAV